MAKENANHKSSGNLGFENDLWRAADALRSNMDAAEYKHVVLGLIFLKYISDAFEEQHAKLDFCFRADPINPIIGYLGSSNLTLAGLSRQGELNVDVLDHDATQKLARWFEERWNDHWCVDITKELIQVIDESWARPDALPPFWIYVKMAYHLAEEARADATIHGSPTRSFVERNYAFTECPACATVLLAMHAERPQCGRAKLDDDRRFLLLEGGSRFHFPKRQLKALTFRIRDKDPNDQILRNYIYLHAIEKGLPLPIIRLIQRAGRVDRIGQQSEQILCYSFLPADGVELIIRLRSRVRQRLKENAEVVGTDETFFEDERHDNIIRDLFTEKSGVLDDPEDNEVDLASLAYQIWKNASDADPSLKKTIPDLPPVVFSTKSLSAVAPRPEGPQTPLAPSAGRGAGGEGFAVPGVMVYVRTGDGNDALAWLDERGRTVTESQHEILRAAACEPATPTLPRLANHHPLVQKAVEGIQTEHVTTGGQLGKPSSARRRVYERLKEYATQVKNTLFDIKPLHLAIDAIYDQPLTEAARDLLNRELRAGVSDEKLVGLVLALHEEDRLCVAKDDAEAHEPQIICSLGIREDVR